MVRIVQIATKSRNASHMEMCYFCFHFLKFLNQINTYQNMFTVKQNEYKIMEIDSLNSEKKSIYRGVICSKIFRVSLLREAIP